MGHGRTVWSRGFAPVVLRTCVLKNTYYKFWLVYRVELESSVEYLEIYI